VAVIGAGKVPGRSGRRSHSRHSASASWK
jgi:hypothetical protein